MTAAPWTPWVPLPGVRDLSGAELLAVRAGGLRLVVELSGPTDGAPLLLIPGLGMQLTDWPAGLVAQLGAAGFRVINPDLRDFGLSQPMDDLGRVRVHAAAFSGLMGLRPDAPYTLPDLADDAVNLLDALGVERAHVCGASMGGMVAQHLAARHPERLHSLALLMTTSGSPWLPRGHPLVLQQMFRKPPKDPDALLAHFEYERQAVAVMADGDRSPLLRRIALPTLVVHGSADRLVPPAAGRDLARRIRGAVLDEIAGLGHNFPSAVWPRLVADLCALVRHAGDDRVAPPAP
ncbi:MAG TPA: alpha/beta fold hydrolase [Burkholderiaceae bacterium]|nr:alpha/beta fold hydrolase [Burkholderiaceae bacterium]